MKYHEFPQNRPVAAVRHNIQRPACKAAPNGYIMHWYKEKNDER